jgi:hypothetical protein
MENNIQDIDSRFGDGTGLKSNVKKSDTPKTEVLSFKSGETVFRVLPPVFSGVARNLWAAFYSRHWVVCNDGSRLPVTCTKTYDQKLQKYMDTCLFCRNDEPKRKLVDSTFFALKQKKEEFESVKETLSEEDTIVFQDEIEGLTDAYQIARSQFQPLEKKYWANVSTPEGEIKLCGMPKTVYEALAGKKEKGAKYREGGLFKKLLENQDLDAIGVNGGAWLVVTRTGNDQFNTEYTVAPLMEVEVTEVKGKQKKIEFVKEAPLSDAQKVEVLAKARDLNTVFDHSKLSLEEQARFIESGYDKDYLFEVFKSRRPLVSQDLSV